MTAFSLWIDELGDRAEHAAAAEQSYRNDFARRVAELAEARAVAFRRVNLMKALGDALTGADDEQAAVAHGLAVLRTRLGWTSDSEARSEILSRFSPVCEAAFRAAATAEDDIEAAAIAPPTSGDPAGLIQPAAHARTESEAVHPPEAALAAFESWYLSAKGTTFWKLFENVMPETPLVDW